MVNQDRREAKVTKENRVLPVPPVLRVPSANQVQLERMGSPGLEDNKASLVRKETKDPEVSLARQALLACRVYRDLLERREKRVMLAKWAPRAPQGQGVHLVLLELMGHKDHPVGLEILELLVRRVNQEKQGSLACRESLVLQVLKAREGRRAKQAPPGQQGHQAPKAPQGTTVPRAAQVRLVFLETLGRRVNLAQLARMAHLVIRVMMENLDRRAPLVQLESQALQGHPEKEARLVQQVRKAGRERRGPRVNLVWKGLLGRQAPWAPRDHQENLVQMDCEESPALWVSKDFRVPQAQKDHQARWVHLVYLA